MRRKLFPERMGQARLLRVAAVLALAPFATHGVQPLVDGGHEGKALTVTGPELLSQGDVAALLSEVTGRPVEAVAVSDDDLIAGMIAAGVPETMAPGFATWGQAIRTGALGEQTSVVQDLTGRAPRSLREVLEDNRSALLG